MAITQRNSKQTRAGAELEADLESNPGNLKNGEPVMGQGKRQREEACPVCQHYHNVSPAKSFPAAWGIP